MRVSIEPEYDNAPLSFFLNMIENAEYKKKILQKHRVYAIITTT